MLSEKADGKMAKAGLIKSRSTDKPKSKAEMMKTMRHRRKAAGLVQFQCWCTPEQKIELEKKLAELDIKK